MEGTGEGNWFTGDKCPGVFKSGNYQWPSIIWFSTPTMPNRSRLHTIDFQFDSESEYLMEARYRALKQRVPDRCIIWTYLGLFETRNDWSDPLAIGVDGNPLGFGHLGKAPGQLIAKEGGGCCGSTRLRNCKGWQKALIALSREIGDRVRNNPVILCVQIFGWKHGDAQYVASHRRDPSFRTGYFPPESESILA